MEITRLHKTNRMSKVVIHDNIIYLCGQVGSGNNITEQTTTMLERVDALLTEVGCDKSRILTSTICSEFFLLSLYSVWYRAFPLPYNLDEKVRSEDSEIALK